MVVQDCMHVKKCLQRECTTAVGKRRRSKVGWACSANHSDGARGPLCLVPARSRKSGSEIKPPVPAPEGKTLPSLRFANSPSPAKSPVAQVGLSASMGTRRVLWPLREEAVFSPQPCDVSRGVALGDRSCHVLEAPKRADLSHDRCQWSIPRLR